MNGTASGDRMSDLTGSDSNPTKDIRVQTTSQIWGIATGMLALCIPLTAITRSGAILPLGVISGAAISTVAIWHSSEEKSKQYVQVLEQRIANLEAIVSSEELELQKKIQQLEESDRTLLK